MFTKGLLRSGRRQKSNPTSSRREMCASNVSNVIYHKFSHGAAFYTLNGKNVNAMLEYFNHINGPFHKTVYDVNLRTNFAALCLFIHLRTLYEPGRVAQSVGHLTRKSGVLGSIPGLATYFRFSFRFFKKGSCQLLAKVYARSTG